MLGVSFVVVDIVCLFVFFELAILEWLAGNGGPLGVAVTGHTSLRFPISSIADSRWCDVQLDHKQNSEGSSRCSAVHSHCTCQGSQMWVLENGLLVSRGPQVCHCQEVSPSGPGVWSVRILVQSVL